MDIVSFLIMLFKLGILSVIFVFLLIIAGGFGGFKSVLLLSGGIMLSLGILIIFRSLGYIEYSTYTGLACLTMGVPYLLVGLLIGIRRVEGRFMLIASTCLILYFLGEAGQYYGVLPFGGLTLSISAFLVLTGIQVIVEAYRR